MTMLDNFRDARSLLLAAATFAALIAALDFVYLRQQQLVDAIAIVDITGSMNARDAGTSNVLVARIEAAKSAIHDLAQALPCGSRLGLGIFTERRSFLLFGPADICANYEAFDGAVSELDWRMAWEGDSYIAKGLYDAIAAAGSMKSNLLFFTDGQEAPPLPASGVPDFEGTVGAVKGLIVGMGGATKVPIPKYDDDGREVGVYAATDVPHVNRHGLPSKNMESAVGWHPRNAPQGGDIVVGEEHLTSMRGEYLKDLATRTGLTFVDLASAPRLDRPLLEVANLRSVPVLRSASVFPATLALALAVALFGLGLSGRLKFRQQLTMRTLA